MQQPEVAVHNPHHDSDRLGIGEFGIIQSEPELTPAARQNEGKFVSAQWSILMS